MRNASSDHGTHENRGNSHETAKSGPSARPISHGPRHQRVEGESSVRAGLVFGPIETSPVFHNPAKDKGKGVLKLKKPTFKKTRINSRGKILGA